MGVWGKGFFFSKKKPFPQRLSPHASLLRVAHDHQAAAVVV